MIKLLTLSLAEEELNINLEKSFDILEVGPQAMDIVKKYNDTLIDMSQELLDLLKKGAELYEG